MDHLNPILPYIKTPTGLLDAVGSLEVNMSQDSSLSLSWRAPFTLDITGIDPDIQYCVDVMTTTSSLTTWRINITEFSYSLPPDNSCHDYYEFTVTPVNVVGNGTPSSLNYSNNNCKQYVSIDIDWWFVFQ